MMRICPRCGHERPATLEHFYASPRGGVGGYCKPCAAEYQRAYSLANPKPKAPPKPPRVADKVHPDPACRYIPIFTRSGLSAHATIDAVDYTLVFEYKWSFSHYHYARSAYGRPQKWIMMHHLIMPCPKGMTVDHINGDKLDNRRSNLRVCSSNDNNLNRGKQRNNRSGYKGVYQGRHGWRAAIRKDKRKYNLGEYATKEQAYEAYCRACMELHGEFANVN